MDEKTQRYCILAIDNIISDLKEASGLLLTSDFWNGDQPAHENQQAPLERVDGILARVVDALDENLRSIIQDDT